MEVKAGEHITVDKEVLPDNTVASYTVNSVQWPVKIDPASEEVLYGDGTPGNPLGVYDFIGATGTENGKPGTVPAPAVSEREYFLKGDGTWANADNTRECTAAEMNAWLDEVDNG